MEINFKNTKAELIESTKYTIKNRIGKYGKSMFISNLIKYVTIIFTLISMSYIYFKIMDKSYLRRHIISTIILSLFIWLSFDAMMGFRISSAVKKGISKNPELLESRTLKLVEESLRETEFLEETSIKIFKDEVEKRKIEVSTISKIVENKYNLYILFNKMEGILILPYEAFRDENQKEEFLNKIRNN